MVDLDGIGPEDRLNLLVNAEPDGDDFDLHSMWLRLPMGRSRRWLASKLYTARLRGDGTWSEWTGVCSCAARTSAAPWITNRAGLFGLSGRLILELSAESCPRAR